MNYNSTRNSSVEKTSKHAIANGISKEGGLFVPCEVPKLTLKQIEDMSKQNYRTIAKTVLSKFLTDFTADEIEACVNSAYTSKKFESDDIAPLHRLNGTASVLELWHGPTCAFKDMALQILPHLMMTSAKSVLDNKKIVILVATSGDTGKAALEGFRDVEGTSIMVFYPEDGVSKVQKLQMNTQEGENVSVCGINGNFDHAQSGVKAIFTDPAMIEKLAENNMIFSSANSINWGRLVPQVVYYVASYCRLIKNGEIKAGDKVNFVVPTGNFGNILAGYYAKMMGIPVNKLICASNSNNVLTDFINNGTYDKNRKFFTTISPSMDILISSNLERLIYELCGKDDKTVSDLMQKLAADGKYTVSDDVLSKIKESFVGGCCTDEQTLITIKETFEKYNYLCDTHTAVAVKVYSDYYNTTGDTTKTVIVSTASPYKFAGDVLSAVKSDADANDEFEVIDILEKISGTCAPKQLKSLKEKEVRFAKTCEKEDMKKVVLEGLNI
ncbi:MAG: threonine synthase [Ruminococcaceae bacterium]|nr:threonine synthase [Oscillospiraceae bacterium]